MIRILFDHQILATQRVGGVSRYFFNLIHNLQKQKDCYLEISSLGSINVYFKGFKRVLTLPFTHSSFFLKIYKSQRFINLNIMLSNLLVIYKLEFKRFHILHVTEDYTNYFEKFRNNTKLVLTVHDLIPEKFPDYFSDISHRLTIRKASFQRADFLICISESTRTDLLKYYDIDINKTAVIHHGEPNYFKNSNKRIEFIEKNPDYIVFIGERSIGYKNFQPMLIALAPTLIVNKNLCLLCIGKDFSINEKELFEKLGLKNQIFALHVDDNDLFQCYNKSKCLIYPSIYEGFGFPLLEAMSASCPILCSSTPSMHEIARNGALYFDPINFENFQNSLNRLLFDDAFILEIKLNQKSRLKDFSWKKNAIETFNIYNSLL